ncbi:MAG: hypothetical protein PVS2B3_03370 [Steroidobacteraceae bacterium]
MSAAVALALSACATHPAAPSPPAASTATQAGCGPGSVSSGPISNCAAPGRTYTQEQLRRTGASNVGQALSQLDPSISAR